MVQGRRHRQNRTHHSGQLVPTSLATGPRRNIRLDSEMLPNGPSGTRIDFDATVMLQETPRSSRRKRSVASASCRRADPLSARSDPGTERAFIDLVSRPLPDALRDDRDDSDFVSLNSHNSHSPLPADEWPILEGAAWHGIAGDVVESLDPHTEADSVAVLLTLLTAFGGAVGRGPHAVADGTGHPGRLFTVLVGDTLKARKGTSWQRVRRLLYLADRGFTQDRILSGFGSGESVVDAISEGDDRRVLVIEPEWARLLAVGKRDGSTMSPLLRQAWDGERLAIRSRSSGTVTADGAHVTALGHVTADELRAKLTDTEKANGFANRHLFALVRRSKSLPHGGDLESSTENHLGIRLRDALQSARKIGSLKRTSHADDHWVGLYHQMDEDEPGGCWARSSLGIRPRCFV